MPAPMLVHTSPQQHSHHHHHSSLPHTSPPHLLLHPGPSPLSGWPQAARLARPRPRPVTRRAHPPANIQTPCAEPADPPPQPPTPTPPRQVPSQLETQINMKNSIYHWILFGRTNRSKKLSSDGRFRPQHWILLFSRVLPTKVSSDRASKMGCRLECCPRNQWGPRSETAKLAEEGQDTLGQPGTAE